MVAISCGDDVAEQGGATTRRKSSSSSQHTQGRRSSSSNNSEEHEANMFEARVMQLTSETMAQLNLVWDEVGYSSKLRKQQLESLLAMVRDGFQKKVEEEVGVRDQFLQSIREQRAEAAEILQVLGVPAVAEGRALHDTDVPDFLSDLNFDVLGHTAEEFRVGALPTTCTESLANLELLVEDLRMKRNEQQTRFAAHLRAISHYCMCLGEKVPVEVTDIESSLVTSRLQLFVRTEAGLEEAVQHRIRTMEDLVQRCQDLYLELKHDPEDATTDSASLGRQIMGSLIASEANGGVEGKSGQAKVLASMEPTTTCVGISQTALEELTAHMNEFLAEKARRKEQLERMGEEIMDLWEMLEVSQEEQDAFTRELDGLGLKTIAQGEAELRKLRERKSKEIIRLIVKSRSKLTSLWDQLAMSEDDEERRAFRAFYVPIPAIAGAGDAVSASDKTAGGKGDCERENRTGSGSGATPPCTFTSSYKCPASSGASSLSTSSPYPLKSLRWPPSPSTPFTSCQLPMPLVAAEPSPTITLEEFSEYDHLLREHESEANRLEKYLESIKPIMDKLEEREQLLERRVTFEFGGNEDENCTLQGRGAEQAKMLRQRLKEEALVRKRLPMLTEKLKKYITAWEEKQGQEFRWGGRRYLDRMEGEEAEFVSLRESKKKEKETKKKEEKITIAKAAAASTVRNGLVGPNVVGLARGDKRSASVSNTPGPSQRKASSSTASSNTADRTDRERYMENVPPADLAATPRKVGGAGGGAVSKSAVAMRHLDSYLNEEGGVGGQSLDNTKGRSGSCSSASGGGSRETRGGGMNDATVGGSSTVPNLSSSLKSVDRLNCTG